MNNVSLRDLGFDQHGAHIRQGKNVRRLLGSDHRLTLQGSNLCHLSRHRGDNACVVKVGFRRIEGGLVTLDLRLDGTGLRLLYRQLSGGAVEILARHRLGLRQLLLTGERHRSQPLLRLRLSALGA